MVDILTRKIYLGGGMSGLTYDNYSEWRDDVVYILENKYRDYGFTWRPIFCNPVDYYNFENPVHKTEKEVMLYDLFRLKESDLVLVNFNDPGSLGTMSEMAIAYDNKIPIIGLNIDDEEMLHPWQKEMCNRIFDNFEETINYIIKYFLK